MVVHEVDGPLVPKWWFLRFLRNVYKIEVRI